LQFVYEFEILSIFTLKVKIEKNKMQLLNKIWCSLIPRKKNRCTNSKKNMYRL